MAFDPEPGLVIRYDFLWKEEEAAGIIEGRKDRPCLILAVKQPNKEKEREVLLCPITHSQPKDSENAVEISYKMARHLKLDDDRMWIKTDQINTVVWSTDYPPMGLVPAHKGQPNFGMMHKQLTSQAFNNVRENNRGKALQNVRREPDAYYKDLMEKNKGQGERGPESGNDSGNDGNSR